MEKKHIMTFNANIIKGLKDAVAANASHHANPPVKLPVRWQIKAA